MHEELKAFQNLPPTCRLKYELINRGKRCNVGLTEQLSWIICLHPRARSSTSDNAQIRQVDLPGGDETVTSEVQRIWWTCQCNYAIKIEHYNIDPLGGGQWNAGIAEVKCAHAGTWWPRVAASTSLKFLRPNFVDVFLSFSCEPAKAISYHAEVCRSEKLQSLMKIFLFHSWLLVSGLCDEESLLILFFYNTYGETSYLDFWPRIFSTTFYSS